MEDIDYSGLLAQYSNKGRNGFNTIMMYATVVYAAMRGIRSVDTIVDLCKRDLAFIWLTQGKQPKRDAFYEFKNLRLIEEVLDDLYYQFIRRLEKEGLVTLKELYIDGTKIEANANRYTFVWLLFVKFYASIFFTLFVPIIHKFFIIMRILCSQFFKLFSTSKNQLYTQFQDRYHFKSCTEIYSQISNK